MKTTSKRYPSSKTCSKSSTHKYANPKWKSLSEKATKTTNKPRMSSRLTQRAFWTRPRSANWSTCRTANWCKVHSLPRKWSSNGLLSMKILSRTITETKLGRWSEMPFKRLSGQDKAPSRLNKPSNLVLNECWNVYVCFYSEINQWVW